MEPFELKRGELPVEPNFNPRKGGNRARGDDRVSQRMAQSEYCPRNDRFLDEISVACELAPAEDVLSDRTVTEQPQ